VHAKIIARPPAAQARTYRVPCFGPDGTFYPSLVEAAIATGKFPNHLSLYVRLGRHGWRRATDEEIAQLASGV